MTSTRACSASCRDLNTLYRGHPALHVKDCDPDGFQWIDSNDEAQSTYSWIRRGAEGDAEAVVVCNFTPVERPAHLLGLPEVGRWREALNTDAAIYGGGDRGNEGGIDAVATPHHGQPASAEIVLPALSTVIFIKD